MTLLIVTDIFGMTDEIQKFASYFSKDIEFCSPYENALGKDLSEPEVYQYFLSHCGHEQYIERVKEKIMYFQPANVIGFSAGAYASWRALSEMPLKRVQRLIGFYPSQIKYALSAKPGCKTDLYLAYHEPNSDIPAILQSLSKTPGVCCHRTRYEHGFMNPLSPGYNEEAFFHFTSQCKQLLQETVVTSIQTKNVCA